MGKKKIYTYRYLCIHIYIHIYMFCQIFMDIIAEVITTNGDIYIYDIYMHIHMYIYICKSFFMHDPLSRGMVANELYEW